MPPHSRHAPHPHLNTTIPSSSLHHSLETLYQALSPQRHTLNPCAPYPQPPNTMQGTPDSSHSLKARPEAARPPRRPVLLLPPRTRRARLARPAPLERPSVARNHQPAVANHQSAVTNRRPAVTNRWPAATAQREQPLASLETGGDAEAVSSCSGSSSGDSRGRSGGEGGGGEH